jgi:Tat protein translocase TatC
MGALRPDVPMPLGAHLDELRKRIILPAIVWTVCFIVAFAFENQLKILFVQPLLWAFDIARDQDPQVLAKLGIVFDPQQPYRVLKTFELSESMGVSMSLAMWAATAVIIPLVVWNLYQFVGVGLKAGERRLAFLFVPAAVILFYAGACLGYYWGMPYLYAWFLNWTANDPLVMLDLRLGSYRDNFFFYTLIFGALGDVPWLVTVVCRVGFTTPAKLSAYRRFILMANVILAALIGPGDPVAMLIILVALQLLFEVGLITARIVGGPRKDPTPDA